MELENNKIEESNKEKKEKKKYIIILITIILGILGIIILINSRSPISTLQTEKSSNKYGNIVTNYGMATYDPNKITIDDLCNFYRKNVQYKNNNLLDEKGLTYIVLENKDNPNIGYYMADGYFVYCTIDNYGVSDPYVFWLYDSTTNTFKEVKSDF